MITIETNGLVGPDGKLTLEIQLPPGIQPGQHRVVVVIEEKPAATEEKIEPKPPELSPMGFMVFDVGPWPEGLSLRREDMYDDDGR